MSPSVTSVTRSPDFDCVLPPLFNQRVASPVTPEKRQRLAQLLGMMGSAFDGEALNAARKAQQLLHAERTTWHEVLNGGHDKSVELGRLAFKEGYDEGYKCGLAEASWKAARTSTWPGLARELRDMHFDKLTPWEKNFVQGFCDRGWDTPTDKQRKIFERIANKLELDLPT